MEWDEVAARIQHAIDIFIERDSYLLEVGVNERSMTHKFAQYLEPRFDGWDVDCEYNRLHGDTKLLRRIPLGLVPPNDLKARTVYPDIIVHRRGTDDNLVVIEAKKADSDGAIDEAKLRAFTSDPLYSYQHGVQLVFEDHPPNIRFHRFPP